MKGGGVVPGPLSIADAQERRRRQSVHGTLPGSQAVTRHWGSKNGREERGKQYRLRIEI